MLLYLGEEHKSHLSVLFAHSETILVDFCKLANDYMNNGPHSKRYSMAAEKLEVEPSDVQNCVQAIIFLLVEACKHNLSEADFETSLGMAGFSTQHQEILVRFFKVKQSEVTKVLLKLSCNYTSYQDLIWKFQMKITKENNEEVIKPNIQMELVLATPKSLDDDDKTEISKSGVKTTICREISEAKTTSECENIIEHIPLNCDLNNLVNLVNKLEQAYRESKNYHVRRVQRGLQKK